MKIISMALSLAASFTAVASGVVTSFDFDGNSADGFSAGGNQANAFPFIDNLSGRLGIDGSTSVLSSGDINIDPQLIRNGIALPANETWTAFEVRFCQLTANPTEAAVAPAAFAVNGTLVILSGNNTGGIETAMPTLSNGNTFTKTLTAEGSGEWMVYTIDFAGTAIDVSHLNVRFDPVGNAAAKNFEVDYVRIT